ncbi:MAG: Gx transporter family protein [Gammaproteobacteria bacterium]
MALVLQPDREDIRLAWLAALATSIHLLESSLPSPLPGIKPGLANIITLIVLLRFGWRAAIWVSLLRVVAGGLLLGTFLSPTFMLSLAGAVSSLLVLGLTWRLPGQGFSAIGLSVLAALAHISGQFVLAYFWFIPHPGLWNLLPVLLSLALILGIINGTICHKVVARLP